MTSHGRETPKVTNARWAGSILRFTIASSPDSFGLRLRCLTMLLALAAGATTSAQPPRAIRHQCRNLVRPKSRDGSFPQGRGTIDGFRRSSSRSLYDYLQEGFRLIVMHRISARPNMIHHRIPRAHRARLSPMLVSIDHSD